MNFKDFDWHDAVIKNIQIDRQNPGLKDTILIEIEWPEEKETIDFCFEEVYWAEMKLNFGIVADETIMNASELFDDKDLLNLYSKWKGAMDGIKLHTYRIELNSTGGEMKIISKTFSVKKHFD